MRNACLLVTLLGSTWLTHASQVMPFADNENISVELSKTQYNRLFIANDPIKKATFPESDLVVKYETDGSVFLDLIKTEAVTVFFKTGLGHHFSMTVKPADTLGQTVELLPKISRVQAHPVEKKPAHEEAVTRLIEAMIAQQTPAGFKVKSAFSSYRTFNKDLSLQISKQYTNSAWLGEVITVYNRSSLPVALAEDLFKTANTKAIALNDSLLAPKQSTTLYLVREKTHA